CALREAVRVARDSMGDHPFREVAPDEIAVARAGVAVATRPRSNDGHGLPGSEEGLRPDGCRHAGAVLDAAAPAVQTAEQPPRCREAARAVDEGVTLMALGADLAPEPEAAAPGARAPRVLDEGVPLDHEGILRLQRLDGQIRRVGDVNVHA